MAKDRFVEVYSQGRLQHGEDHRGHPDQRQTHSKDRQTGIWRNEVWIKTKEN